ncbi:MAG: toll/interleukin-1 receptor domain-containing protein [Cytophagales bacterium]|nr:toll/interleukin-1 receptor domain-containing protein [Cytophagales bacterium]
MPKLFFISHSSEDDAFVTQLAKSLRAEGFATWVDHENIAPAAYWRDKIKKAMEQAVSCLLVLSPQSIRSHGVLVEWHYFFRERKPILPILFGLKEPDIPYELVLIQYVDFGSMRCKIDGI